MTRFTVLMAEDDPDDRFLIEQAFLELESRGDLRFVEDGEELINYLFRSGKYADPSLSPRPSLILLDLNMPKKDGREVLTEIKKDPELQKIPVVVWTTSNEIEDKIACRKAGASKYVTKPIDYAGLVDAVKDLVAQYSSETAAV
jgi:two-component system, response regulator